jgi:hypothetical protein
VTVENRVLALIAQGKTPAEIKHTLGINKTEYNTAIRKCEESGVLSRVGDLPHGAETEICPPPEMTSLSSSMLYGSGWSDRTLNAVRSFCVRYGWMEPIPPDERYTRAHWTGQAVRRVDFCHHDTPFMVCGFLIPRPDKKAWERATPQYRLIYVETPIIETITWVYNRRRTVNADVLGSLMAASGYSAGHESRGLLTSLALAVAWVNESRAILRQTSPSMHPGHLTHQKAVDNEQ